MVQAALYVMQQHSSGTGQVGWLGGSAEVVGMVSAPEQFRAIEVPVNSETREINAKSLIFSDVRWAKLLFCEGCVQSYG